MIAGLMFLALGTTSASAASIMLNGSQEPLSLTFLLLGIGFLCAWAWGRGRAKRTMTWPQVPGKIVESSVVGAANFDADTKAHIVYSYEVNGIALRASSVGAGKMSSAAKLVKRYPVGKQVQVFYNPGKPKSALLERSGSGSIIILVLSIVNLVLGFGALLDGFIHSR
jgi:hypothetical protein